MRSAVIIVAETVAIDLVADGEFEPRASKGGDEWPVDVRVEKLIYIITACVLCKARKATLVNTSYKLSAGTLIKIS